MRLSKLAVLFIGFACALPAQNWELGASGGYSSPRNVNVTAGSASGSAGFASGGAVGALFGNQVNHWVGGEARFTYESGDLQVSSGPVKATSASQSYAIHYDVLIHAARTESRIRPFVAAGGGVKLYRGIGSEPAYQPLSNLVVLTHTHEAQPLISVGGGVKFLLSHHVLFRLDFRDYATPVPTSLLAAPPNSRVGGWIHDLVGLAGISTVF